MSALKWPDRLVDLAAWELLPQDECRHVECSEGILFVAPSPPVRHQLAMCELYLQIRSQLPDQLEAIGHVEVLFAETPLTVRAPDLLVTSRAAIESSTRRLDAADVRLAAEILSDGSRRIDRVMKFSEYAEARIHEYWILDLDDGLLTTYELGADGSYKSTGDHTGLTTIQSCGTTVTIDVASLA